MELVLQEAQRNERSFRGKKVTSKRLTPRLTLGLVRLEPHSPVFRIAFCNYRAKCIDCCPEFCHEVSKKEKEHRMPEGRFSTLSENILGNVITPAAGDYELD